MKNNIVSILILLGLLLGLTACNQNISTIDLTSIKIETDESGIITQINANNIDTELLINNVEGF